MNMKRIRYRFSFFLTAFILSVFILACFLIEIFINPTYDGQVLAATDWNLETDGDLLITSAGSYYVSGATTSYTIKVQTSSPVTVTLNNVTIDVSASADKCAFDSGKNVTLYLNGENTLKSSNRAGIKVGKGDILTIGNAVSPDGSISTDGFLSATGSGAGAGIGSVANDDCGNIIIRSGTICAFGGYQAPGIGSSRSGGDNLVTITGGSVKAAGTTGIKGIVTNGFSRISLRIITEAIEPNNPARVDYYIPVTSNGYKYDYTYSGSGHRDGDTSLYFYLPDGVFTTTSLKSDLNPSSFGGKITFTASVSPSSASGYVEFIDNNITIATTRISNGKAVLIINSLSAGTHRISAIYDSAEGYFGSRSGIVSQIVNRRPVSLTIACDKNNIKYGDAITFTVSINPSEATGSILFYNGSNLFGIVKISNGRISLTTDTLDAGRLSVKAKYSGNKVFAASITSPVVISVIGTSSIESAISGITPTLSVTPAKPASKASSVSSVSKSSISDKSGTPYSTGSVSIGSMPAESEIPAQLNNIKLWVLILFVSLLIISVAALLIISRKRNNANP